MYSGTGKREVSYDEMTSVTILKSTCFQLYCFAFFLELFCSAIKFLEWIGGGCVKLSIYLRNLLVFGGNGGQLSLCL